MLTLRYVLCDVFTERALAGNPLCVFTDARRLDAAAMQALARETNLSETVFVLPPERGGHAKLRIFTPRQELAFAGHPTLGTAFVLGGAMELGVLRLELASGIVAVKLEREGARVAFGWMTPPPARTVDAPELSAVLSALGVARPAFARAAYDLGADDPGANHTGHSPQHILVPLGSREAVRALTPNSSALALCTSACVSAFYFDGERCKTRAFAPRSGITEDPATGSAAVPIALHLLQLGLLSEEQLAARALTIEQGEELLRPSTLYVRQVRTEQGTELELGGAAVTVARGQFSLPEPSRRESEVIS